VAERFLQDRAKSSVRTLDTGQGARTERDGSGLARSRFHGIQGRLRSFTDHEQWGDIREAEFLYIIEEPEQAVPAAIVTKHDK